MTMFLSLYLTRLVSLKLIKMYFVYKEGSSLVITTDDIDNINKHLKNLMILYCFIHIFSTDIDTLIFRKPERTS